MLYVTTRSSRDAFTASRTLHESQAPDGGGYLPLRLEPLDPAAVEGLMERGFSHCVAEVLNLFFGSKLSSWDVDFCIGKSVSKLRLLNHRMVAAELWHNEQWEFAWILRRLSARLKESDYGSEVPAKWTRVAVRTAVLFGIFSELRRGGELEKGQKLDIALTAGDFTGICAAWQARDMGLDVGTIVCACTDVSTPWDLMNYGQMRTEGAPPELERLISMTLGCEEASRFSRIRENDRSYTINPAQTEHLRRGIFTAVVGNARADSIIPNVYRTSRYLLDPDTACAFGGVQDYRAKTGEVRPTLLIMEKSPGRSADRISRSMGMTVDQLLDQFSIG